MTDRKKYVEELIDAAQMLRRRAIATPKGADAHITASQWIVIGHISRFEGCTTNDVATALKMTGSAVTQLVNGLVEKGYIRRKLDPSDRRAYRLVLSPQSRKKVGAFKKKRVAMMLRMFDALTDAEFEQFAALNKKILASLAQK